jgi:hypothetical protein
VPAPGGQVASLGQPARELVRRQQPAPLQQIDHGVDHQRRVVLVLLDEKV